MSSDALRVSKRELAFVFLRIGITAFGGPAAHIAMMEQEFVGRRQWLSREKFLDLVGAASLIPGPSSSELAIYIGQLLAGVPGLLIAGVCFIFPAALIVLGIAWGYVHFGTLPQVVGVLYGIKPIVIAVVLQALFTLSRVALKTKSLMVICVVALVLGAYGFNILLILMSAGGLSVALDSGKGQKAGFVGVVLFVASATSVFAANHGSVAPSLTSIVTFFLKVGSVQFGSGYVLLAFLREDLVKNFHWLTEAQLLDAVAVGQVTPGPVFTTATFIGYLLRGFTGAILATIAIFLPGFILVSLSGHLIPKLRQSILASKFLDGVVVASLAVMACVSWTLGRAALVDGLTVFLAIVALGLLIRFRVNSAWLVLGGALVGLLRLGGSS